MNPIIDTYLYFEFHGNDEVERFLIPKISFFCRTDGWTDGRSGGRADGRTDARTLGQTDGRLDGRTVGRRVGRAGGQMDERTSALNFFDQKPLMARELTP